MKNYLFPTLFSSLTAVLLLQGCGSSESNVPVVEAPIEYTFSLTSQLANECGVKTAFTEVELLLQDETWQTLSTHQADENGVISFITENEFINYTIIAKDQKGSEAEGLNVVSFYQASSDSAASYQAQFDSRRDNSSCECLIKDLELSHDNYASVTSVTSSLTYQGWKEVDEETTLFEGVKVCREIDGNWLRHSFSVLGNNVKNEPTGSAGFIDDFSGTESVWELNAFKVASTIDLPVNHQEFSTSQIINNLKHFPSQVSVEEDSLLIFDTHNYISETSYQSTASVDFDERDSVVRYSVVRTTNQITSTSAAASFLVRADERRPAIDDVGITEIKSDGTYDYSAVAGYPMAIITYTFLTFDPATELVMPAKWTFYGPESGVLAISALLTGYDDIIDIETRKDAIDVRLIKSNTANQYQDYIKYYQNENNKSLSDDFVSNISEAILYVEY